MKIEKEPVLMIEGIDIRELGEIFSGYYLNNSEEVTKIINLYRNQVKREMLDDEIKFLEDLKIILKDEQFWDIKPSYKSGFRIILQTIEERERLQKLKGAEE